MIIWLICLLSVTSFGASWYCKRKTDHSQPELSEEFKALKEKYDYIWCDENNSDINANEKVIYLTFDAGYENGNIEKILNVLKEEGVPATFFLLDNVIIKNTDIVKRMIDEGHTIGNHTLKHKDVTKFKNINDFEKELNSLNDLYEEKTGEKMSEYFRPPEGKFNEQTLIWAKDLGYKTVFWSFAYADWDNGSQPDKDFALKKIFDNIHNGEIMLLHPTSSTNAEIIKSVIKELKNQGFKFEKLENICEKSSLKQ